MICTPHPMFLGSLNQEEQNGRGIQHVWGRRKAYTGFWWGVRRE